MEALKQGIGRLFHRRGHSFTTCDILPERAPATKTTTSPFAHRRRNTCALPITFGQVQSSEPTSSLPNHRRRNTTALPPACVQAHPAFKALYSSQRAFVSQHKRGRSKDLQEWTRSNEAGLRLHSEDVADRNLIWEGRWWDGSARKKTVGVSEKRRAGASNRVVSDHRDWPFGCRLNDCSTPLKITEESAQQDSVGSSPILSWEDRPKSLARKRDVNELRDTSVVRHQRTRSVPLSRFNPTYWPSTNFARDDRLLLPSLSESAIEHKQVGAVAETTVDRIISDLTRSVQPAIDWSSSVEPISSATTTVSEKWMSAVTHETIVCDVHEVREERIVQDIHKDHFYHRIQPVVDVEILPARHFLEVEGGYMEISEDEVPIEQRPDPAWITSEIESRLFGFHSPNEEASRSSIELQAETGSPNIENEGSYQVNTSITHSPIPKPAKVSADERCLALFKTSNAACDDIPSPSSPASLHDSGYDTTGEMWPFVGQTSGQHPAAPPRKMQPLYITEPWNTMGKHHGLS